MPGSAQTAITVESAGSQANLQRTPSLQMKPDLLSFDPFAKDEDLSQSSDGPLVGFAAGWAAATRSAGLAGSRFPQGLGLQPGSAIGLPDTWTPGQ